MSVSVSDTPAKTVSL